MPRSMKSKSSARFAAARPQTNSEKPMLNSMLLPSRNGSVVPNRLITNENRYSTITPIVAMMTVRRNLSVTLMIRVR